MRTVVHAGQQLQVIVELLDSLHELLDGYPIGFLQTVADAIPFGLSGVIVENYEEMKPHTLHEEVP